MQNYIRKRAVLLAQHILETSDTVRETAKKYAISKSTVHKDMVERLPKINPLLAQQVQAVLAVHKAERHLRGGEATKKKYGEKSGKSV